MTALRGEIQEPPSQQSPLKTAGDEKARARERIGSVISDKYKLDSLLGVGGMASVYSAVHTRTGSRKALKILHTELAHDRAITDRFLREGRVPNRINHRGRVAIDDDGFTDHGEPYLVMELLEGETAQALWKRRSRRLPIGEALWIASEVLDVLEAFHKEKIVHRDIKPANIFITGDGVVKILDFGVARMHEAHSDKTHAGTALGTPSFMAPEQAMGLIDGIDGRADVFSVGATLYALLSGQRLHQGRSDNEAFILAATQPAPSLARVAPELPIEVVGLVDKALAWDQRSRFQTAALMRDECVRLMEQHSEGAPQAGARVAKREERVRKAEAAALPIVEEMQETEEQDAEATDPQVVALVDLFRRWERLLPTVRHYGWAHPETDNKLRATYQGVMEALRADPTAVHWMLKPYAFLHRGQTVWEPEPPLDAVPYHLFAAGIRRIELTPGFSEEEMQNLCEVMLLDPAVDLAPEDDVAAALWERRLEHVRYDAINVFAEGDAADREEFWAEADDLEELARKAASEERANRVEAAAMAIETDQAALRAARQAASALALDPVARKALGAQLGMTPERWTERFVDVMAEAILDAKRRNDLSLVLEPLDASTRDLVLQRRFDLAFSMFDALAKAIEASAPRTAPGSGRRTQPVAMNDSAQALKAELACGMFSPETLRLLLREATRAAPRSALGEPLPEVDLDALARDMMPVIAAFGPSHLEVILDIVAAVPHEGLRRVLFGYLERVLPGREAEVVDKLMTVDVDVARPILKIFAAIRTASATEALRRLAGCANALLRCEATAQLAMTADQLKDDLLALSEAQQPEVRVAALRTLAHHQVKAAGPLLVRKAQEASFVKLTLDERREILSALFVLHPVRGEQVSIELLQKKSRLGTDDALEQTRLLAADLLSREGRSPEALNAAIAASKGGFLSGNSPALRERALAAAHAIAARLGKTLTESGELT